MIKAIVLSTILVVSVPTERDIGNIQVVGSQEFYDFNQARFNDLEEVVPVVPYLAQKYIARLWEQTNPTSATGFDPIGHDGYGSTIYSRLTPGDRIWPKEAAARLTHEVAHATAYALCWPWYGVQGEAIALGWQASALEKLGGNQYWVDYYRDSANNHALKPGYPVGPWPENPKCEVKAEYGD